MSGPISGPVSGPVSGPRLEDEIVCDSENLTSPSGPITISLSGPSGPAPKKYKYGLTDKDSPGGQVQLYKAMLLSYNPMLGNGFGYPYNVDSVENCILWIDLNDIRSTRPNDSASLDSKNTFVSKLSGKSPTTLPMFIYNERRNILIYNKALNRYITLPKGNKYSLRTPPVSFGSGQSGGANPVANQTETYEDFIDRATIVSAGIHPKYTNFDKLQDPLGYPIYITNMPGNLDVSNNVIWIPQNPKKPLTGTGWMFNAPIFKDVSACDSIVLYKISKSIDASKYGYLHNKDMSGDLQSALIIAERSLVDTNAKIIDNKSILTDLSSQYVKVSNDLSNESVNIDRALLDINRYNEFLYDAFTTVFEYSSATKSYKAIDFEVKHAQLLSSYNTQLELYKTNYINYLTDHASRHTSHNYVEPNLSTATGFASYLLAYTAQNRIINIGRDRYLNYTKSMYDIDMKQYRYDSYVFSKKVDAAAAITGLFSDVKNSRFASYGINDGSLRPIGPATIYPKLILNEILKYDTAYVTGLMNDMNTYIHTNVNTDMRGEAAIAIRQYISMNETLSRLHGEFTRALESMDNFFFGRNGVILNADDSIAYSKTLAKVSKILGCTMKSIIEYDLATGVPTLSSNPYQNRYGRFVYTVVFESLYAKYNAFINMSNTVNEARKKCDDILKELNTLNSLRTKIDAEGLTMLSMYMNIKTSSYTNNTTAIVDNRKNSIKVIIDSINFFKERLSFAKAKTLKPEYPEVVEKSVNKLYSLILSMLSDAAMAVDLSGALNYFSGSFSVALPRPVPTPVPTPDPTPTGIPGSTSGAFASALSQVSTSRDRVPLTIKEQYDMLNSIITIITNTTSQDNASTGPTGPAGSMGRDRGDGTKRFWTPDNVHTAYEQNRFNEYVDAYINKPISGNRLFSPILASSVPDIFRSSYFPDLAGIQSRLLSSSNIDISGLKAAYIDISNALAAAVQVNNHVSTYLSMYSDFENDVVTRILPPITNFTIPLSNRINNDISIRYINRMKTYRNLFANSNEMNTLRYTSNIFNDKEYYNIPSFTDLSGFDPIRENDKSFRIATNPDYLTTILFVIDAEVTNSSKRGITISARRELVERVRRLQAASINIINELVNEYTLETSWRRPDINRLKGVYYGYLNDFYLTKYMTEGNNRMIEVSFSIKSLLYTLWYKSQCSRIDTKIAKDEIEFFMTPEGLNYCKYLSAVSNKRILNADSLAASDVERGFNRFLQLPPPSPCTRTIPSPITTLDGVNHITGKLISEITTPILSLPKTEIKNILRLISNILPQISSSITQIHRPIIGFDSTFNFSNMQTGLSAISNIMMYKNQEMFSKYYDISNTGVCCLDYNAMKTIIEDKSNINNNITLISNMLQQKAFPQFMDNVGLFYWPFSFDKEGYLINKTGPEPTQLILNDITHRHQNPLVTLYKFNGNTIFNLESLCDIATMTAPVQPPPPYTPFNQPGKVPYEKITFRYREAVGYDDTIEYWFPDSEKVKFSRIYRELESNNFRSMLPADYTIATTLSPWTDELFDVSQNNKYYDTPIAPFNILGANLHRPMKYRPAWVKQMTTAFVTRPVDPVTYFNILSRDIQRFSRPPYKYYIDEYLKEEVSSEWNTYHKNLRVPALDAYAIQKSTKAPQYSDPPTWWKLMELKYRTLYYLEKSFNSGTKQSIKSSIYRNIVKHIGISENLKNDITNISGNIVTAKKNIVDPSMRYRFMFFKLNGDTEISRNSPSTEAAIKSGRISPILNFFSRGVTYNPTPTDIETKYYSAQFIFRAYIQANNKGVKPSDMISSSNLNAKITINVEDQTILPDTFMKALESAEKTPTALNITPIDTYNIELNYFLTADGGDEMSLRVERPLNSQVSAPSVFTTFIAIDGIMPGFDYIGSDTFDDQDGNYMNPEGRVLVNSPLLTYHRELQRIVLRSTVEKDLVINEILVFNRLLSASEIDTIVSYLSYKWVCMKYMPITSRFFPDNYRSNYDSMMLETRQSIYNSMYNVLDPILSSLNATSYTKANKTGNAFTYFIENTKITSEYVTSYVNDTMNQAYIYRDTTLFNVIQRYRQLFRYLTKAAITYIPPTRIDIIPPVDPDSNIEIINLKAAVEAIKKNIDLAPAENFPGFINMSAPNYPMFVTQSPYSSVINIMNISFAAKNTDLMQYFGFVEDVKNKTYDRVRTTRPYKGPDSEFVTSTEILTVSAATVYLNNLIDTTYNNYYQTEKDKQTAAFKIALERTSSLVSPSFNKHLADICAIENRPSKYILDERTELDGLTGKMDTFFKSLWTIPDNLARMAAELEQKAEEAKQAAIMKLKNSVRTEIALENATLMSARIASISSALSKNRSDLQSLGDIAVKNSQYVYDDLSANILGQLLSDFNEIMSEDATSILGDLIFNMNGLTAAGKYDRELIELFSTYDLAPDPSSLTYKGQPFANYLATLDPEYEKTVGGVPYGKNGMAMNVSPRTLDVTFAQTYKSIDMISLTILQALIVKYTKIFNTLITGLSKGTLPLYNIHLYIYYLTNYLSNIKYISDTILDTVMSLTPKIVSMLKLIPGKIDEARFKGSLVDTIKTLNKIRSLPTQNVMSGGASGPRASGPTASGPTASGSIAPVYTGDPIVQVPPRAPNFFLGQTPTSLPFIFDGFTFDTESDFESYVLYNSDYPVEGTIWASALDRSATQLSYITDYTLVGHWYKAFILNTYNVIKNFQLSLDPTLKEVLEHKLRTPLQAVEENKTKIESYINDLEKSGKLPSESLNQYKAFLTSNTNVATASAEMSALGISNQKPWTPSTDVNPSKSSTFAKSEKIMKDISNTVLHILKTPDPMQTLLSLEPKFEMKYPSYLYPIPFKLISLLISDLKANSTAGHFATASKYLVDANNSIAEYSVLIKPHISSRNFPENIKELLENEIANIEQATAINIQYINEEIKPLKIDISANFYDKYNNALAEMVDLNEKLTSSGYYSQLNFSKGITALPKSEVIQKYVKSRYIKRLNPVQSRSLGIPFILVDSSGNPADGNGNTLAAGALYTPIDPYVEFMTLSQDGLYFYYDYNNPTLKDDIAQLAVLQRNLTIAQTNLDMNVANVLRMYDTRDTSINRIEGDNSYKMSQISVINMRYSNLFQNGVLIPQQEYIEQSRVKLEAELAAIQQKVNTQIEMIGTAKYNNALNLRYYLKGSFTENLRLKLFPKLLFRPFKDIIIPQQIDASGHILIDVMDKNSILLINAGFYFQGVELPRAGLDTGDYYILSNNTSYPLFVHIPSAASTTRTMIPPKGVAQYSYSLTKGTSFYGFTLMTDTYLPDILRGVPRTGTVATVTEWDKTVFIDYTPRFTEYTISPTSDSSGYAIDVVTFEQKDGSSVYYDSDDVNQLLPIPVRNLGKMSLNDMKLDKSFKIEPPETRTPSIYFLQNTSSSIRILCNSKGEIAFDVNGDMKTVPGPLFASSSTLYYQDISMATVYPVAVGTYTGYTSFSPTVSTEYLYRTSFCTRWLSATGPYVFCNFSGDILIDSFNKPILLPGLRASSSSNQILAMKSQSVRATYYESQTMVQSSGPSGALVNASPPRYCIILQKDQIKNNDDIIARTPPDIVNNEPVSSPLVDIAALRSKRYLTDTNNTLYYRFKAVIRILLLLKVTYSSGSMMSGASSVFSEIQKNTPNLFQQIQEGIIKLNETHAQLSSDIQTVDTLFRKKDEESFTQLLAFAEKAEGALQDLVNKVSFSEIMSTYAYYIIAVKEAADLNTNIVRILGQIQGLHSRFSRVITPLIQAQTYLTPEEVVTYTKIPLAPIDSRLSNLSVNAQIVPVYISNLKTAVTSAAINQYLHSIYRVQTIATSSLFAVNGYLSISGDHINLLRAELVSLLSTRVQERQSSMLSLLETAKNPVALDIALQTYSPETYTKLQGFKRTIDGVQINLTVQAIRAFATQFRLGDLNSTTGSYTAYISATRDAFEKLTLIENTQKQMAAYYKEVVPSIIAPLVEPLNTLARNILNPIKTITDTIESTRAIIEKYKLNTSPILYTVEQTSVILDLYRKITQAYSTLTTSYSADLTKLPDLIKNAVFSDILVYYTTQPTDRTKAITAAIQEMAAHSFSLTTYLQSFSSDNTQTLLSSATTLRKSVLNQKSQFDRLFAYITQLLRSIGISESRTLLTPSNQGISDWRKSLIPFTNQLHFSCLYAAYITSILKPLVRVDLNSSSDILMTTVTSLRKNADIYTNLLNMMYSSLETIFTRISALPLPRLIAAISPLPTRSPDTDLNISVMNDVSGGVYPETILPNSTYYAMYDGLFVPYMTFYRWIESYKPVMDALLKTAFSNEVPVIYSIYDLCDSIGKSFEACITNGLFGAGYPLFSTLYNQINTDINAATCSLYGLLWKRITQIVQHNKIPSDTIKTVLTDILNLQESVENQALIIQYYTVLAGVIIDDSVTDAAARLKTIGAAVAALNITTKPEITQRVANSMTSILPLPSGKSFIGETSLEQKIQWLFTNREIREKKSIDLRAMFLTCIMYDIIKYKVRFVPAIFSVIGTAVYTNLLQPNIFDGKRVFAFFDSYDVGADQQDLPVTLTKLIEDMFPKDIDSFSKSVDRSIFSTIDLYSKQLLEQNPSLSVLFQGLDDFTSFMSSYTEANIQHIIESYYPSITSLPIQNITGTGTQNTTGTGTQNTTAPAIQNTTAPAIQTTTTPATVYTPYDPNTLWDPNTLPQDPMSDQTGGSYTIPYQYENPQYISISKLLSALYSEYLTESAKTPANFYSVKLIIDTYSDAFSNLNTPSAAETNIYRTLSTSVAGNPIYSAYTNTNKYDLTYLSGVPGVFKISIPVGSYSKEYMNYWIYFINTIFTEADTFLKVLEAKGLADKTVYDRKKLTSVGNPSSDIEARASDRARATSLLRTPMTPVDLPGPSLGPRSTSGPPAPRMTGGYTSSAPPPGSGPLLFGTGAVSIPGPSLHGRIL